MPEDIVDFEQNLLTPEVPARYNPGFRGLTAQCREPDAQAQGVRQRYGWLIQLARQQQHAQQVRFVDFRTFDLFAFIHTDEPTNGTVSLIEMPRLPAEQATGVPTDANTPFSQHLQDLVREGTTAGQLPCQHLSVDFEVEGTVWLRCQRCLKAYERPLPVRTYLEVMRSRTEADAAPLGNDEADVVAGSQHFNLITQVGNELLLALPVSPRRTVCLDEALPEEAEAEKKSSPFTVLVNLKTKHQTYTNIVRVDGSAFHTPTGMTTLQLRMM